jgi:hypothetical protein
MRSPVDYDLVVCVAPFQVTLLSSLVGDRFQSPTDSSLRDFQKLATVGTWSSSALALHPTRSIRNSLP